MGLFSNFVENLVNPEFQILRIFVAVGFGLETQVVMINSLSDDSPTTSLLTAPSGGGSRTPTPNPSPRIAHVPTAPQTPEALGTMARRDKIRKIKRVLQNIPVDLALLRQLAIGPGGLVADELRRHAWPLLARVTTDPSAQFGKPIVGNVDDEKFEKMSFHGSMTSLTSLTSSVVTASNGTPYQYVYNQEELEGHRDYQQVLLDVRRTLARFPPNMQEEQKQALIKKLTRVVVGTLIRHPEAHYYQGFHDICLTILLVVGEVRATAICDRLVGSKYLSEYMLETMEETSTLLYLLYPLVGSIDPELERFLHRSGVGVMFALSWLITWYGHVLSDFRQVVRLYDLFLASHPLMPLYLAGAVILWRSSEVLTAGCDMPTVHSLLTTIPDDWPLESLIGNATDLFLRYPPSRLMQQYGRVGSARKKKRWALMPTGNKAFSLSFWTFTLTAVAYYAYNHYADLFHWERHL